MDNTSKLLIPNVQYFRSTCVRWKSQSLVAWNHPIPLSIFCWHDYLKKNLFYLISLWVFLPVYHGHLFHSKNICSLLFLTGGISFLNETSDCAVYTQSYVYNRLRVPPRFYSFSGEEVHASCYYHNIVCKRTKH